MALENWDWYISLADAGSMTKAASSTGISQQTLSARLAALEKDLGAKLVQRRAPLTLTPAGNAFLLYARDQQQTQRDLLLEIGEVSNGGSGLIKVGIAQLRARALMPQAIARMRAVYPNIRFEMIEQTNYELVQKVERGEVDLCVARFSNSHPGLDLTPLYEEQVVLAIRDDLLMQVTGLTSEEAKAAVAEEGLGIFAECPFGLGLVEDMTGRIAYTELRNAGIRPKAVITSEYTSTLLAACAAGVAATFTPASLVAPPYRNDKHIALLPLSEQAHFTIGIATPARAKEWQAVNLLRKTLLDMFA